ncbi:MAG: OmpA family protein [Proteobacteria bacterium]|nr:OmpA family protein [Pseudomonadota bacterium]
MRIARRRFLASAAATGLAIAAAPARANVAFVAYFEPGQSTLSETALGIVDQAAAYALSIKARVVLVDGHADTAGTAEYNLRLSRDRAVAVAAALEARGLSANVLKVAWHGETDLAEPTPAGAGSALNRRVTIDPWV